MTSDIVLVLLVLGPTIVLFVTELFRVDMIAIMEPALRGQRKTH